VSLQLVCSHSPLRLGFVGRRMERVWLGGFAGVFGARNVQIDDDWFLAAADDDGFDGFVGAGVELLVGDVGRDVDEIAGAGFVHEFKVVAPAEAGATADDVDDGFEFAVMVRAGFGVGMNEDGAGPEFLGADFGVGDGFGAGHAGSLQGVGVELAVADDAEAVEFPVGRFGLRFRHVEPLACQSILARVDGRPKGRPHRGRRRHGRRQVDQVICLRHETFRAFTSFLRVEGSEVCSCGFPFCWLA
jgi:hypothetical protein